MKSSELSNYIEGLCSRHKRLRHRPHDIHFVNLNEDKKQTYLSERMHYPCVVFSLGDYTFDGMGTDVKKVQTCRLQVLSHVRDTADYCDIEEKLSLCDSILSDIFAKILDDRHKGVAPFLRAFDIDGLKVQRIENNSNALYGYHTEFTLSEQLCVVDRLSNFETK